MWTITVHVYGQYMHNDNSVMYMYHEPRHELYLLADPGRGTPPPNGRGPMICYAQNAIFFSFCSSLAINFKHTLIEIWPKHAKNEFYFNLQHFQLFSTPPPSVDKVHALPPKIKSWIRH